MLQIIIFNNWSTEYRKKPKASFFKLFLRTLEIRHTTFRLNPWLSQVNLVTTSSIWLKCWLQKKIEPG